MVAFQVPVNTSSTMGTTKPSAHIEISAGLLHAAVEASQKVPPSLWAKFEWTHVAQPTAEKGNLLFFQPKNNFGDEQQLCFFGIN